MSRASTRRPSGATGRPCGRGGASTRPMLPTQRTPGGSATPGGGCIPGGIAGSGPWAGRPVGGCVGGRPVGGCVGGRAGGGCVGGLAAGGGGGGGAGFGDAGAIRNGRPDADGAEPRGGPGGGVASIGRGSPSQPSPSQYRWVVGSAGSLYHPGPIPFTPRP